MTNRRWGWLIAVAAVAAGLGWQRLMRRFRPTNPELAVMQGREMVRRAQRVLAITAHPDDLELAAGGTLRLLGLAGSEIHIVVLSDGRQQNSRPGLGRVREFEQQHAGEILGYGRIHQLGLRDLSLSRSEDVELRLREVWSSAGPELVLAFDPGYPQPQFSHPDHLSGGRAAINLSRTELGQDVSLYLYGTRETNVVVDITPVIEDKVQSVLAHRSQFRTPPWLYALGTRIYSRLSGLPVQLPYGEGFRALDLPELSDRAQQGTWPPEVDRERKSVVESSPENTRTTTHQED